MYIPSPYNYSTSILVSFVNIIFGQEIILKYIYIYIYIYSPIPVSLLTSNKRSSHLNILLSDIVLPIVKEFTLSWDELVFSLLISVPVLRHSPLYRDCLHCTIVYKFAVLSSLFQC